MMSEAVSQAAALGQDMHDFVRELFPICRSVTGDGVRQTLARIQQELPGLAVHEVASGTEAFDWKVPDEWNAREAWIENESGERIVDFSTNNLHLLGYSEPVEGIYDLEDLRPHLYSLPDQPDAIPYITSYYKRRWGFCLSHTTLLSLRSGKYRVKIDTTLAPGHMTYGELIIPGTSKRECLISTYVCHPSMANNELSGPAVATWLAKWLMQRESRLTYRFIFIPETIGSIYYLSRNYQHLKEHVELGYNLSCVGDERVFSYLPSRKGGTTADRIALHVLKHVHPDFKAYSFLDRGSDERQFCAPGIDLPVCSILRSKFGAYPEYHTSLDNLELVTPAGLGGTLEVYKMVLELAEQNAIWRTTTLCEPQLGKRDLYPTLSTPNGARSVKTMMNILAYADGSLDLIALCDMIGESALDCLPIVRKLQEKGLLEKNETVRCR